MNERSTGPQGDDEVVPRRVTTYLYPWDLVGDPDVVSRLQSAGFGHVAVAAAYHSVRAATPQHPRHRFVVAENAALYRPVRAEAWGARRLAPRDASWTGSDDSFGQAVTLLEAHGVRATAWVVLTHNSELGRENRDLAVRNCFGESYEHALCPANPEVREYAALLAAEAVRGLALEGISLEACGQLGSAHGGHHDKTVGAYSSATERLLSICCCGACFRTWATKGLEAASTVQQLRVAFEAAQRSATDFEEVLDNQTAEALLGCRQRNTDLLLGEVFDALGSTEPSLRVTLHAEADPWVTGASPGLTPWSGRQVDAVLVPVDANSESGAEVIATAAAACQNGSRSPPMSISWACSSLTTPRPRRGASTVGAPTSFTSTTSAWRTNGSCGCSRGWPPRRLDAERSSAGRTEGAAVGARRSADGALELLAKVRGAAQAAARGDGVDRQVGGLEQPLGQHDTLGQHPLVRRRPRRGTKTPGEGARAHGGPLRECAHRKSLVEVSLRPLERVSEEGLGVVREHGLAHVLAWPPSR